MQLTSRYRETLEDHIIVTLTPFFGFCMHKLVVVCFHFCWSFSQSVIRSFSYMSLRFVARNLISYLLNSLDHDLVFQSHPVVGVKLVEKKRSLTTTHTKCQRHLQPFPWIHCGFPEVMGLPPSARTMRRSPLGIFFEPAKLHHRSVHRSFCILTSCLAQ